MTPEQLKASILKYAMQGKLVEQKPEDGTGEDLFCKMQQVSTPNKNVTPIVEEEIPFDIPSSWKWCKFGELVDCSMGKTPPRAEPVWWQNDIHWVSISDMKDYGHISYTKEMVSQKALEEKFGGISTKGTLLMSFKLTVGRTSILAEYSIKCSDKDIVLGTDTFTHSREIYSPSRNHANLQAQCCKINIENCLPQPSMDVRFEDILEFKSKRKDELNAFRAKIRELEINIYNADSPELIRHYETQFIEEWQQCSQDYYKALKDSKLAFFLSSLVSLVGIPFVGQQLSTYIGQDVTPLVQTGAQLLKIGIGYFDYRNKISPAKADGGFSYIIKANRDGIIHI